MSLSHLWEKMSLFSFLFTLCPPLRLIPWFLFVWIWTLLQELPFSLELGWAFCQLWEGEMRVRLVPKLSSCSPSSNHFPSCKVQLDKLDIHIQLRVNMRLGWSKMTRLQWKRTKTRVSLETRKNPAYGRSSLYSFSSKVVNSKARQEVGTPRRLCAAQERETSPSNSSAFAVNCKRGYQQCPMILCMSEFDPFSSWEPDRKCLSQVSSQPRGAAPMRGRRLQVSHSGQMTLLLFHFPLPTGFCQAVSEARESCRTKPSQKKSGGKTKNTYLFLVSLLGARTNLW